MDDIFCQGFFFLILISDCPFQLIIACSKGGTSIEDLAEKYPDMIIKVKFPNIILGSIVWLCCVSYLHDTSPNCVTYVEI
jgi:hypothetical protein